MKCILSLRVARHLLSKGFQVIDIEPSRKVNGQLVFIFEETPELIVELAELRK
ncbi:DUF5659 domain-containing protein [Gottfriedia luciferensis]|uniref:DUF5659 domain-containing protein n=1 Tax=Gottfriedia luciferensis TaxID=178774 RepID=UPI00142E81E0|nr:DUF5659 domain-containing protein [Gottfriedia luciferensis]